MRNTFLKRNVYEKIAYACAHTYTPNARRLKYIKCTIPCKSISIVLYVCFIRILFDDSAEALQYTAYRNTLR